MKNPSMSSDEDQHAPIAAVRNDRNDEDEEPDDIDDDDEETEEEEEDDDGDRDGGLNGNNNGVEEDEEEDVEVEEVGRTICLNSDPTRSVTIAVPPPHIPIVKAAAEIVSESTAKRPRVVEDEPIGELRRANPPPSDDQARKLFQRLWTDEDEIGLLQGFLDYSTQRGTSQNNPHDTALFYDQIKSKLQLDFNKNQLVEKLRRLKKKYRNVLARVSSGKEIQFKSPHDQATFEIASKIWGTPQNSHSSKDQTQQQQQQQLQLRGADVVDDDMPPNFNSASAPNLNLNFAINSSNFNNSGGYSNHHHSDRVVVDEWKSPPQQQKAKKRIRVKMEDTRSSIDQKAVVATHSNPAQIPIWPPGMNLSTPSLIEEMVKNRVSPLMYDINGNGGFGGIRGLGDGIVMPMPLSFPSPVNAFGTEVLDDRWRKQQILELEVYSKRLELVQEQIKLTLEQLRSTGS